MKRLPHNLRAKYLCTAFIILTVALTGCASGPNTTPTDAIPAAEPSPQFKAQMQAFNDTLDLAQKAWQQRVHHAELDAAITHWQAALELPLTELPQSTQDSAHAEIYWLLSRAYHLLADSHIRLIDEDEQANYPAMMQAYEKGIAAAEMALALRDPEFVAKISAGTPWPEAVLDANITAIPALYWYSANLGNWARIEGIATVLARKDDIKATMDFIVATQPDFFYGAAYRYLGVYWVSLPFGNDPQKSLEAFNHSLEIAPNFFATHVLIAENLAPITNNTQQFNDELNFVINTPANIVPEIEPENTLEQEKARRLLKNVHD